MSIFNVKLPGNILGGAGAVSRIAAVASGKEKVVIFTDRGVREAGLLEAPLKTLKDAGIRTAVMDSVPPEPSWQQAQQAADRFREEQGDMILAIGGGSVMDMAKLASVLASGRWKVKDLLDNPGLGKKTVMSVMVPTTAGTGAEATPNSIVAVPEKEVKVGIVNPEMVADVVILDGEMIKKLPEKIAASTGVDALAHAVECYTSKKATPFSDTFALEALDKIIGHIEKACRDPEALEDKNEMLLGAFYAGIAITASGTTAVHALSYPLGGKYHIPHGAANAMLLAPVMRFNEPCCRERLAAAYDRVANRKGAGASQEEKSRWMVDRIESIVKNLDIPAGLREYHVPPEDLEGLVASGLAVRRLLDNNMRQVTADDARRLYLEIMR